MVEAFGSIYQRTGDKTEETQTMVAMDTQPATVLVALKEKKGFGVVSLTPKRF